jgi:hypothetical protein
MHFNLVQSKLSRATRVSGLCRKRSACRYPALFLFVTKNDNPKMTRVRV